MSARWSFLGRVLLGVGLLVLLGGPGPGSVGSCSETESSFASAPQHCVNKGDAICARVRARCVRDGMPDCDANFIACRTPLPMSCRMFSWNPACSPPTQDQADACIDALLRADTLDVPDGEIDTRIEACREVTCAGRSGLHAPEDAGTWTDGSMEGP